MIMRGLNQLNVQQLFTFRTVFDAGGYAAAASESGLSVPTVWQHIRAVERAYDVRLFSKVGRRIEATAAGKRLYNAIDEVLVSLESTLDVTEEDADTKATMTYARPGIRAFGVRPRTRRKVVARCVDRSEARFRTPLMKY